MLVDIGAVQEDPVEELATSIGKDADRREKVGAVVKEGIDQIEREKQEKRKQCQWTNRLNRLNRGTIRF